MAPTRGPERGRIKTHRSRSMILQAPARFNSISVLLWRTGAPQVRAAALVLGKEVIESRKAKI